MKCERAVIAVAGYGTRFGVAAASTEKCMALVDGKPVVQYVVEDCVRAGITDITFVVGSMSGQIRRHFGGNTQLEQYLEQRGKTELLGQIRQIGAMATYNFVEQRADDPYGTAVPLALAELDIAEDEQVLYLFGDQLYHHSQGGSEAAHLLARTTAAGAQAGMLVTEVAWGEIDKYGIVSTKPNPVSDQIPLLDEIIEKPPVGSVDSNLNNGSFFVIGRGVLPYLRKNLSAPPNAAGEHYFTDVLNEYAAAGNDVAVITAAGTYLDCGTIPSLRAADHFVASQSA